MATILTQDELLKRRVQNEVGILSGSYYGKAKGEEVFSRANDEAVTKPDGTPLESIVVAKSANWENTKEYADLWNKIEDSIKKVRAWRDRFKSVMNINQFPGDYYDLIDRIRIDITRRRLSDMDFTSEIANEIVRPDFSRAIVLQEFLPFTGVFKKIKGSGDSVPLIQQKTGDDGTVTMDIYGIGHSRSLEDELYNTSIYSLQKVNAAVVRAYTALRNSLNGIGTLVDYSINALWPLSQQVAPSYFYDANGQLLYDLSVYHTLRNALRKLLELTDPQTGQEITPQRVVLLVRNNNIVADVQKIINGQLAPGLQNASTIAIGALGIDEVWQYKGDTLNVGPQAFEYPGVPEGKAYLFVVGSNAPNWVFTKRGLTQEVGRGDVLSLSREERAWYCVHAGYRDEWLGEAAGLDAGTGYCVEIELPVFDEET
jgi:hypothetical protein